MATIEHELRMSDAKGVAPPQNWTTRAADEIAALRKDAERYRKLRDGQNWPAVFARHDAPEPLRGVDLDAALDGAA